MMASVSYPSGLPCPQTSTVTPAERRALSNADRPREARNIQRDRLEYERLTWPPMRTEQTDILMAWWRDTLIFGGAWFESTWPLPRGLVAAVRKLREQPKWEFVAGGFWRLSALCEVRGRGESPVASADCAEALLAAELAQAEASTVYEDYYNAYPPVLGPIYYQHSDPGPAETPWTFPVSIAWADLAEPPGVTVFSGTRNGAATTPLATLTITDIPTDRRSCRACVFQTYGGWDGLDVAVPNTAVHAATFYADAEAGFWAAQFLLINEYGDVTGEFL